MGTTPVRMLLDMLRLGLGTIDQAVPSQCSVRVRGTVPLLNCPTAQMSLGDLAATAARPLPFVPILGLGTTDQVVPSQCSVRVCMGTPGPAVLPTAHTSLGAMAATPASKLLVW